MMTYKMMEMLNYYRFLDLLDESKYTEALDVIRLAVEVAEEEYIHEGGYTAKIAYDWRDAAFNLLVVEFPKLSNEHQIKDRYTDFDRQLAAYIEKVGNLVGIIGRADHFSEDMLSNEEIDDIWEVYEKLSKLEEYLEEVGCMAEKAYKAYMEYYRPTADLEDFEF